MSAPESLKDIYADEIKDLWSANDQMARSVKAMAARVHDPKLEQTLEASVQGITKHTGTLKDLLERADEEAKPEKCQGMAGLTSEAEKHTAKEAPEDGELLDILVLSQYHRIHIWVRSKPIRIGFHPINPSFRRRRHGAPRGMHDLTIQLQFAEEKSWMPCASMTLK
jgi:hypothetical protein